LMMCVTHFLGDGMALHLLANDFFLLLGSCMNETALLEKLTIEWSEKYIKLPTLPSAMEDRLPSVPPGKFYEMASVVDFNNNQRKIIGGHTFPRQSKSARKIIVRTICFDREKQSLYCKTVKHTASPLPVLFLRYVMLHGLDVLHKTGCYP